MTNLNKLHIIMALIIIITKNYHHRHGLPAKHHRNRAGQIQTTGVGESKVVAIVLMLAFTKLIQPGYDLSTNPAANTPSQFSWKPLQARVCEIYQLTLTMIDPYNIDSVVVSGLRSATNFNFAGTSRLERLNWTTTCPTNLSIGLRLPTPIK